MPTKALRFCIAEVVWFVCSWFLLTSGFGLLGQCFGLLLFVYFDLKSCHGFLVDIFTCFFFFLEGPARSALQAMLANLGGEEEVVPSTPAPPVINVPPPVRLSGSRATSEIPPIASVAVPPAGGKVIATPVATTADEPFESALGLGELAGLTVSNEAEALSYEARLVAMYFTQP